MCNLRGRADSVSDAREQHGIDTVAHWCQILPKILVNSNIFGDFISNTTMSTINTTNKTYGRV